MFADSIRSFDMRAIALAAVFAPLLVAGCAAPIADDASQSTEALEQAELAALPPGAPGTAYYIATRRDTRVCVAPGCGGVFLRAVNTPLTTCADGTQQAECHAADLDLSALGLTAPVAGRFEHAWEAGQAIVAGRLGYKVGTPFRVTQLTAIDGWNARALHTPTGEFSRVTRVNTDCGLTPCPYSYRITRLNVLLSTVSQRLDLAASGASPQAILDAQKAIATDPLRGILVAGTTARVNGRWTTTASEFYTRVRPMPLLPPALLDAPEVP